MTGEGSDGGCATAHRRLGDSVGLQLGEVLAIVGSAQLLQAAVRLLQPAEEVRDIRAVVADGVRRESAPVLQQGQVAVERFQVMLRDRDCWHEVTVGQ